MALGWAIYGTWNWWTWWLHEIYGTRGFEHEIFWTRDFLNTNRTNNTNLFGTRGFLTWGFWHTDLTDLTDFAYGTLNTRFFYTRFFWTRITRITRIFFCTRIWLTFTRLRCRSARGGRWTWRMHRGCRGYNLWCYYHLQLLDLRRRGLLGWGMLLL